MQLAASQGESPHKGLQRSATKSFVHLKESPRRATVPDRDGASGPHPHKMDTGLPGSGTRRATGNDDADPRLPPRWHCGLIQPWWWQEGGIAWVQMKGPRMVHRQIAWPVGVSHGWASAALGPPPGVGREPQERLAPSGQSARSAPAGCECSRLVRVHVWKSLTRVTMLGGDEVMREALPRVCSVSILFIFSKLVL